MYGQTLFPWFVERGEETRQGLERIRKAAFFYCRETLTLGMLERAMGEPRAPHLRFMPDCCFGIDVRDDAGAGAILDRAGLEAGKFLTVQLRTKTPARLPEELPPGYRPEWNSPVPDEALDTARADKFASLITAWVRRTGLRVLIAPEAKKEMAHNRRLIVDRLPADARPAVATLETFWSVMEAASVFRQARVVVCHEPHSPIIALANGVPAVHTYSLEHGPKYHMFADLGLGDWLLDHDRMSPEQLLAVVMGIHEGYDAARSRVSACMAEVHRLRRESMGGGSRCGGGGLVPGGGGFRRRDVGRGHQGREQGFDLFEGGGFLLAQLSEEAEDGTGHGLTVAEAGVDHRVTLRHPDGRVAEGALAESPTEAVDGGGGEVDREDAEGRVTPCEVEQVAGAELVLAGERPAGGLVVFDGRCGADSADVATTEHAQADVTFFAVLDELFAVAAGGEEGGASDGV